MLRCALLFLAAITGTVRAESSAGLPPAAAPPVDFVREIQPIFAGTCHKCHGPDRAETGYRLDIKSIALGPGSNLTPNILPGNSKGSLLIHLVSGTAQDQSMPPKDPPLTPDQIALLSRWIDEGASWPEEAGARLKDKKDWWSLKPLVKPPVPMGDPPSSHPVDSFISAALRENGLSLSPEAEPGTLIRRVFFDLTGLPPSPEEVDEFVRESPQSPRVYEALVDRLLASPRYGERWARHWLDVVHYGETHGFDKDQPRPHAWPYRDYVIRAFNEDRPYARFVQEQLAGDVLFPHHADGIVALGFIAAGPWDLIGHAEVEETKTDGKIARHLDRDDMVANTINTFCSLTVHCAQCHDHKFDAVTAEDYYGLQAVFAALDRADRPFDADPDIASKRADLMARRTASLATVAGLQDQAENLAGNTLRALDQQIAALDQPSVPVTQGWHSALASMPDTLRWVQVDLGASLPLTGMVLFPCRDSYNGIGDGFGFPVRFKVEASDDAGFLSGVTLVLDETGRDFNNPGISPVHVKAACHGRYVRITATRLASRKDGFIFALAELEVKDETGQNRAAGAAVTSLDSIEAGGRWSTGYLTDQAYPRAPGAGNPEAARLKLGQARRLVVGAVLGETLANQLERAEQELAALDQALKTLPAPQLVYAGTIHTGSGTFAGTGARRGEPRPIALLARGDVRRPGREVRPGAIAAIAELARHFDLPSGAPEGERRAALARWITDPGHPLTWRSIVNRLWHYHFGRGLVETPNDFGRMGGLPSHPGLLDWLAVTFRDDMGGSMKQFHRLIVTSATYRQQSGTVNEKALQSDSGNTLLWRQNRRKLEAEAIRDSVLAVSGKLDYRMGGPGFRDFVMTHPGHSPHYHYHLADPEDPALHRRSVYRFLVRSQQQPWMAALDCADPSMLVEKRNQTITPLQALGQMNNSLMVVMASHFAARAAGAGAAPAEQVSRAFRLALQRGPEPAELEALTAYAASHGMANTCRLILNLNEFVFVD